ncbi:unnamed protein product [Blepharisma stoltei]|uniref:NADH dehydrogenase subunit 4L n=1 Tax=Blepharisma stoltei TaxID=1481888 RepID=A0AAU9JWY5_9CILI|nr:unnamed protein product [Blepharisma stoltei]
MHIFRVFLNFKFLLFMQLCKFFAVLMFNFSIFWFTLLKYFYFEKFFCKILAIFIQICYFLYFFAKILQSKSTLEILKKIISLKPI